LPIQKVLVPLYGEINFILQSIKRKSNIFFLPKTMEGLRDERMGYVLVVKEDDHKLLMEWVNGQRQLKEVSRLEVKDKKGRLHIYEWIKGLLIPIQGNLIDPFINGLQILGWDKRMWQSW
jgi:hypothetical protein